MTYQPSGPGKTSPKLYQDFLAFDPIRGNPNVLAEHPTPAGDGPQLAARIGSCKHEYTTKFVQSIVPPLDLRPDGSTTYKLAVICKTCRIHADIRIDHSNATNACPSSEYPLHHFVRVASHDIITTARIRYAWLCSAPECQATLLILFRRPRLSDADLNLLNNPELLKRRHDALVQEDPHREGVRQATPMDGLSRLRRYIKDSLNEQHNKRQFPANNKRFQEAFGINGRDCYELLERLGFKYAVSSLQEDQDTDWDLCERQDVNWTLPNPEPIQDRLQADGTSHRELLEDVEMELLASMYKLSAEQGLVNPAASEMWTSANRDIERTLAAQGYTRHVSLRRPATSNTDLPYFYSLGALPEFSDELVAYAYDRQVICDIAKHHYYFECLQCITESRGTEQLQMKVATLESQNIVSRRDVRAAYRAFNITPAASQDTSDSRIIELFQAQQADLGAVAQEQARGHLYKLGVARNSNLLINASRQSVDTYEDALSWLGNGVTKDTPDEGILAVVSIKTSESTANEEIAQKAVSTIAKARHSNMLNEFLLKGSSDGYTMSVDEALRHLNIEQKLESIDQTILPAIFDSARQDRPGETTNKAIATIQQALSYSNGGTAIHSPDSWPVGLTSHGNTCYLNSLLQYYFSIQPLRDIVLDYDSYKLDTSSQAQKEERVGQRKVSMVEIKGGQRFAEDLKHLFQHMITSPALTVKPEEDLVCRAFLDPKEYRLLDTTSKDDEQAKADSAAVNGVTSAADEKLTDGETLLSPAETLTEDRHMSDASSTTLQASVNGEDPDISMNTAMPPTPPASPGLKGQEKEMETAPPPLPPRRRFSTAKEEALKLAQDKARQQQDVTEVHDAIMFRLRCGMKARGHDASEEQEDALRDLFSIHIEETAVNDGVQQTPKLLADSNIQLNVPYEATDIYSALDEVFDLQQYGDNPNMETFKSIKALPPLLQINIPRIGYDSNRAGGAFKVTECVRLEDELYLDRYHDYNNEDILAKRRQCWAWRKRLQTLRMEQKIVAKTPLDLDGPTTVAETAKYLASLDGVNADLQSIGVEPIEADGEITSALATDAEEQAARVHELQSEIDVLQKNLDAQFTDMKKIKYRLAAVFFHRGAHGHGHYWIYIHDFANNIWRMYNDERVEEFTKLEEIFEAKTWQQGTPTYAVYVAEDQMGLVQTICRNPEQAPTPPEMPELVVDSVEDDVQMGNADSQNDAAPGTIDPKLITEGGQGSWDATRQVAAGNMW